MNQNTIKVLLADDNKDFCDIIVDHLNKQEDITVVAVAMDGIDAMNKIRDTHPDVAVIDGIMPRLDGLGVLERLQKTEERRSPDYNHSFRAESGQGGAEGTGLVQLLHGEAL